MPGMSIFDMPVLSRLVGILGEVRSGQLQIPAFQRDFEWRDDDRLMLMDSIYQGLPIGSLLVWRPSLPRLARMTKLGPHQLPDIEVARCSYLLDGLQRLTTLYAALTPLPADYQPESNETRWPIYFDLRAAQDTMPFRLLPRRQKPALWHMPMHVVLDNMELYEFQKPLLKEGLNQEAARAEGVAHRFKDYVLPVVPLYTDDLRLATESFVRVNRQGHPVSELHMTQALLFEELGLEGRLKRIQAELAELGWGELSAQELLNILKVRWDLDVYKAGPDALIKKLKEEQETDALFDTLLAQTRGACELLREWEIHGPPALPYAYQLVVLADVLRQLGRSPTKEQKKRMRQWFWLTTYTERFTGATGSQIRGAIHELKQWTLEAKGLDLPLPDTPLPPIVEFRFFAVRSRAWAIQSASLLERPEDRFRALSRLGEKGGEALEQIDRYEDPLRPENRVLLPDSEALQALRQAISDAKAGQGRLFAQDAPDAIIRRYLGIPRASSILASGGPSALLDVRKQKLEAVESALWCSLLSSSPSSTEQAPSASRTSLGLEDSDDTRP